jgi:hypothetical protein
MCSTFIEITKREGERRLLYQFAICDKIRKVELLIERPKQKTWEE